MNTETGKKGEDAFQGHEALAFSVLSSDGKLIVSGSWDNAIRIWDVETGKEVGKPFPRTQKLYQSLTFSPDGKRMASRASDALVRIWDVERGKQVGEPLCGHICLVWSVASLHDGKRVVSGSRDLFEGIPARFCLLHSRPTASV